MNCHSPIRLCTDGYRQHCKPSTSLIARCCWQPNESSTQRDSGLIPCCIWCQASGMVWFARLCCDGGLLKDIEWWVCPAGHWRRRGSGAWSGWCSTSGRSHIHNPLSLRRQKCTRMSVIKATTHLHDSDTQIWFLPAHQLKVFSNEIKTRSLRRTESTFVKVSQPYLEYIGTSLMPPRLCDHFGSATRPFSRMPQSSCSVCLCVSLYALTWPSFFITGEG